MTVRMSGFPQLRRRLNAVKKSPRPMLAQIQLDAVAEAKSILEAKVQPRKTGDLERSIKRGSLTASFAIVEARKNYAAFVELGTRPHRIPKTGSTLLAWPATAGGRRASGAGNARARAGNVRPIHIRTGRSAIGPNSGTFRYAMHVQHPGTKPKPFLLPGAKAALEKNGWADVVVNLWNGAA